MNTQIIDSIRIETNAILNPKNKVALGQFMTPSIIAQFMANMLDDNKNKKRLLDCGAGIGSLTIEAVKKLSNIEVAELWEIDPIMQQRLASNMNMLGISYVIHPNDFIHEAVENILNKQGTRFTHAIINPPYKKINSNSEHRLSLRNVGIETVNLYTGFLALTIKLLENDGQVVAIIPRSFCNGPYYKPFREIILNECSIDQIHVFESRDKAFQDDEVLQENIIIKLTKGKQKSKVKITESSDHHFNDHKEREHNFSEVVRPSDKECFINIPKENKPLQTKFSNSLFDIGLNVSTGPIVSHRLREFLKKDMVENSAPVFYPHHFIDKELVHPQEHKKTNSITIHIESKKWLMPNIGFYVIVRRFSSKEEKRRVVANIVDSKTIKSEWLGFDNCWNVFHIKKAGFNEELAKGLACYLNSTHFDDEFRIFSGHTQVNATDLKNMTYPSRKFLDELGKKYHSQMKQEEIDELIGEMNDH